MIVKKLLGCKQCLHNNGAMIWVGFIRDSLAYGFADCVAVPNMGRKILHEEFVSLPLDRPNDLRKADK
jgi:hypothetical protein